MMDREELAVLLRATAARIFMAGLFPVDWLSGHGQGIPPSIRSYRDHESGNLMRSHLQIILEKSNNQDGWIKK